MTDTSLKDQVEQLCREDPFIPIYAIVIQVLRDNISNCTLKPGEHLKEIETAEKLGVSRSTVRRAFDVLVLEGVVLRRKLGGVEIAPMLRKNYREIAEIRIMLDCYAARLAAIRRTEEDLQQMKKAVDQMLQGNIQNSTKSDLFFHKSIYLASKNRYIMSIYENFNMEMIRTRYLSAPGVTEMRQRVAREHLEIYEAIRLKDANKAVRAAQLHAMILMEPALISAAGLVDGSGTPE